VNRSSGSARVVLLVGIRKGLLLAESDARRCDWRLDGPQLAGYLPRILSVQASIVGAGADE
jgi:hypothetical protein